MKALGVLVMMALVIGAFTSIPNVSAIGVYGDVDFTKAKGTKHLTFGSASGKVCGAELCGSKSMPQMKETQKVIVESSGSKADEVLKRALEGQAASLIMNSYNDFKGIEIVQLNVTENVVTSDFNAYANPGFLHQEATSTVMKTEDDMTIIEKKKIQEDLFKANYPSYLKESYANPDHPQAPVKEMIIENMTSTEIVEVEQEVMLNSTMADMEADIILFNLGFDIDMSKIGVCGPGTDLIDGICFIHQDGEDINTDWADYWDTKEDKEIVLEQVIMTNGTQSIPVVDDMDTDVVIEDEVIQEPVEEPIVIPSFEESTLSSNSTSVDIESIPVPEVLEEVVEEVVVVDTTVVVDGKTFKDQASADRFMAMTAPVEVPIVVEEVPEVIEEPVIIEPEIEVGFEEETNDVRTTNQTEAQPEPETQEEYNPRLGGTPPPFQP